MTYRVRKVSASRLRKDVFNQIDSNRNGKIDAEETKMGAIFGLKEGDKKIAKKGFDRDLAMTFLTSNDKNAVIEYKKTIDDDANINRCYNCHINEKNHSLKLEEANDNTVLVQYGDGHNAVIDEEGVTASVPDVQKKEQPENIDLCVECDINIVDNSIDIDDQSKGNTIVYQDNKKTVVIEDNKHPVNLCGDKIEVNINDCINCDNTIEDSSTNLTGDKNRVIHQEGNSNKGEINK